LCQKELRAAGGHWGGSEGWKGGVGMNGASREREGGGRHACRGRPPKAGVGELGDSDRQAAQGARAAG
jgi:hypothetical protein